MSHEHLKRWAVMVYFAADNNLDNFATVNLDQMKQFGSSDEVDILAQIDLPNKRPAKRYHFSRDTPGVEDDVVERLPANINTGDPAEFVAFLKWGFARSRAEHYLVVIWGHGKGWDDLDDCQVTRPTMRFNVNRRPDVRDTALEIARHTTGVSHSTVFAIGDDFGNDYDFLNSRELKKALLEATKGRPKIDILGMDACLMGMAEVSYQVRESVDVLVASEDLVPNESWPYDRILARLHAKPTMDPKQFAAVIVYEYVAHYRSQIADTRSVTQSACDLSKVADMAEAIDCLGRTLRKNLPNNLIRKILRRSRRQSLSFYVPDYVDLFDFCNVLKFNCESAVADLVCAREVELAAREVIAVCNKVMKALAPGGFILATAAAKGLPEGAAHGLSIYFPSIADCYTKLDLAQRTRWDEFLSEYSRSAFSRDAEPFLPTGAEASNQPTIGEDEADLSTE